MKKLIKLVAKITPDTITLTARRGAARGRLANHAVMVVRRDDFQQTLSDPAVQAELLIKQPTSAADDGV